MIVVVSTAPVVGFENCRHSWTQRHAATTISWWTHGFVVCAARGSCFVYTSDGLFFVCATVYAPVF